MITKNEIKYIQSLYHKKTRDAEGLFIAEGEKLVNELLQSNFHIQQLYATTDWATQHASINNISIIETFELEKISNLATPNQVLAIVEQRKNIAHPLAKNTITLVLDGIQDPGNMGTIIRIADWFGIHQIIASNDTVDIYNSKVVQSTMGSIIRVNCWYTAPDNWLQNCGVPVYGALLNGVNLQSTGKISEAVLVIGNESKGIRPYLLPHIQHAITIPKIGGAESLNAAVATGIILSHWVL
jgi:RNA methyltransferase, TrmH family